MNPVKTAIASYGMSGEVFHAPFLHTNPKFELVKVLERTKNRSLEKYPYITVMKTYEDIIHDPEIELVIVNTPDHTHYELAKKALIAGKHVIVEKPFVQKVTDGEELIRISHDHNKILSVFQNRRWDGDFLTVKKIIEDKVLGKIVEFEIHFDRFRNYIKEGSWREDASTGTGTVFNLGSHLIDQALILFGQPQSVTADVRILRPGGSIDDYFNIWLDYPEIKVILKSTYLAKEPGAKFTVHGMNGSFIKFGVDPQEEMLKAGHWPDEKDWGKDLEEFYGKLNTKLNHEDINCRVKTIPGNYKVYFDNIYEAIREKTGLLVTPEQALDNIRIIEAVFLSHKEKRSIVF
jgi:predicted dehydrogenase